MGTQRPPKKGHSPQFLAHVCCGQRAKWIKMPLRTEVGDIVLDGQLRPHGKGHSSPPTFCPMSNVAKWSPISSTAELLLLIENDIMSPWHAYAVWLYSAVAVCCMIC